MNISKDLLSIDGWNYILKDEIKKEYFKKLENVLRDEYEKEVIFPKEENIFNSLKLTSYKDIKAVIIGQDPYHGFNQANGLAFSVSEGVKYPPSLKNIFKELEQDTGIKVDNGKTLVSWAKEGVLLLNTVFTVRKSEPNSHKNIGWEQFTKFIIDSVIKKEEPVVFILWGNNAKKLLKYNGNKHKIITSSHPSPLSAYRNFFGSKPFTKTNKFLVENNIEPINWEL